MFPIARSKRFGFLQPVFYVTAISWLSLLLTACGAGNSGETIVPDEDDETNVETPSEPEPAGPSASFTKQAYDTSNTTPFPTAVYLKLKGNAQSAFELADNQTVIDSGNLPLGDKIGPASGIRSAFSSIERVIVLADNTDHVIRFSITTPDDEFTATETTLLTAGKNCVENLAFFTTYIEDELDDSCGSCHSNSGTASGWTVEEGFSGILDYAQRRGAYFYEHPTSSFHGGGRRWDLDDNQALRMAEFVYRAEQSFVCPE